MPEINFACAGPCTSQQDLNAQATGTMLTTQDMLQPANVYSAATDGADGGKTVLFLIDHFVVTAVLPPLRLCGIGIEIVPGRNNEPS